MNFSHIRDLTKGVRADLLVLPELFATGYAFNSKEEAESLAEKVGEETTQFLHELSTNTGAVIVGGFAEKSEGKIFNSALTIDGSKIVGVYRKIHLFKKEKTWFSSGDTPFPVYELRNTKVGVMICFDWAFPEAARTLALRGAEIIAHPSNLVLPYCQKAMTTRCLENRIFAITSNRIGQEKRQDDLTFTGQSQITSCDGSIIASGPKNTEEVKVIDIDISPARDKSITPENNVFLDRRTEFYNL